MSKPGLSKVGLDRMHEVMAGHVEHGGVPGLVTLVSRRGEVHVDAQGTMAMGGEGGAVQRDSIFRVASMTKPVAAVAAMILVEECTLRLDEPVDRWVPELADRQVLRSLDSEVDDTVPAVRPITVRDVLTFRMGAGMIMAPPGSYPIQTAMSALQLGDGPPEPQTPPAPDEWIRRFGTLPLLHQPGEQWTYNSSADVLGVLVERASGQPFATFLRERVFEPLGMKDTGFSVPPDKIDRLVTGYLSNFETGAPELHDEAAGGQWSREPRVSVGCRRIGLHRRRLRRVRPDDAEPRHARQRAHPVAAFRRDDDVGSADAGGQGRQPRKLRRRFLRHERLGLRDDCDHTSRHDRRHRRSVRLGRWARHVVVRRSVRRDGHRPAHAESVDVTQLARRPIRLHDERVRRRSTTDRQRRSAPADLV